jgi:hypoxia up-regulated 1
MARLWKDAEKIRQVLSANSETHTSFEGLYDENVNFKYKLTRANFEKMASHHAARVRSPLEQALSAAGLQLSDIDSVVLHGGAIRTPFVQKELETVCGSSKKIRTNVNADEAAVFGAAFTGAALSSSFRVRDIRSSDAASYPIALKWNSDGKERNQKLFTATSQVGPEKQVTVKNLDDFEFSFYQLVGQDKELPVLSVQTQNLTASVARLRDSFGCSTVNITTKFSIRLSPVDGLPEVVGGTVSCEVESEKKGSVVDDVKGFFGLGKKDEQQPLGGEENEPSESITLEPEAESSTTSSSSETSTTTASKDSKKATSQTKEEIIPISLKSTPLGTKAPSASEMTRIRDRLAAFDASDRDRVLREEALNELESFIYRSRDLMDNEEFVKAVKKDQLTLLSEKIATHSDWLYEDSDNAKTADFQLKLKDLKDIVDPAQKRVKENAARPLHVKLLKELIQSAEGMQDKLQRQIEADENAYSSSLSESSSTSSSTETPAASSDPLDDLAEDPYSTSSSPTSTKKTAAAKPTGPSYGVFTPTELSILSKAYEYAHPWLENKLAEQEKLTESDDPVLTLADIDSRIKEFERVLNRLYKKMNAAADKVTSAADKLKAEKERQAKKEKDDKKTKKQSEAKDKKTKEKEAAKEKEEEEEEEEERKDEL